MTPTLFDVKKLCHRNDPDTSRKAAEKMVKSGELNKQERWVMQEIENSCLRTFTALELARGIKDKLYYIIQRRLSGLREKGKIRRTGEKRDGCMVWELVNAKGG